MIEQIVGCCRVEWKKSFYTLKVTVFILLSELLFSLSFFNQELFACGYMVCNWLVSCILIFVPRFESMFLLGASVSTNPVLQESLRILFPLLINVAIFLALAGL